MTTNSHCMPHSKLYIDETAILTMFLHSFILSEELVY